MDGIVVIHCGLSHPLDKCVELTIESHGYCETCGYEVPKVTVRCPTCKEVIFEREG